MLVSSKARQLARVLRPPSIILHSSEHRHFAPDAEASETPLQRRNYSIIGFSGLFHDGNHLPLALNNAGSMVIPKALYSSGTSAAEGGATGAVEGSAKGVVVDNATEAVKELYDKMLDSVLKKRSMPPNAWLWSLLEKCSKHDDIKLLFDILQHLRRFRLSNLRIHENFNCNLCREIAKACVRVGAIDFGMKTLWKHNVQGLTPSIASAHQLLLYAKQHNDADLMVKIMTVLTKNDLPLQPGTADIVFSICYNTDNWDLLSKYSKKFVKAGAKLRQTSFDIWMEFATNRGDVETLWTIEKLRSVSMKRHSISSGISCAKGLLLEQKPDDAAAIIQVLYQTLSDARKPGILTELQKLVSDWPLVVIKHQKDDDKKALAVALQRDIPAMVSALSSSGLKVSVNMEVLTTKEGVLC